LIGVITKIYSKNYKNNQLIESQEEIKDLEEEGEEEVVNG
jgi:hypothetical protein